MFSLSVISLATPHTHVLCVLRALSGNTPVWDVQLNVGFKPLFLEKISGADTSEVALSLPNKNGLKYFAYY